MEPWMKDPVLESRNILDRFRLDGRKALVTGAGQGIGRAMAHGLGEAGAAVAVVDISAEHAHRVVEELTNKGIDSVAVVADITDQVQVNGMVEKIVEKWGSITIGVNNAGMGVWSDAETMPKADWDRLMALNLDSVFFCAQAESTYMLKAGYGKIINTASMSAHIVNTPQNQCAYNASKAAVLHLTKSLGAEWAPKGVRVNSISPGYTKTKLVADLLATPVGKSMEPVWLGKTPSGRMGEVTDLQGAVVFLASEVSDNMTGADIIIDGGYCAW